MTASARHTASYYAASSVPQPDYPALTGEVSADVCVIGGGFSGLNTALELAERGFSQRQVRPMRRIECSAKHAHAQRASGARVQSQSLRTRKSL